MYKKFEGLGDSFYQDKAKTINSELKKLKIPLYVVCGRIEKATGKPKMLWKKVGDTCDSDYPNIRTTGESAVEKFFDKNLGGSSLQKFMKDPSGYASTLENKMNAVRVKEQKELEKKLAKKAPKLTKAEKKKIEEDAADLKRKQAKEKRDARKATKQAEKEAEKQAEIEKAKLAKDKRDAKKELLALSRAEKKLKKGSKKKGKTPEIKEEIKEIEKEKEEIKKEEKVEHKHERKPRYSKGSTAHYNNEEVKILEIIKTTSKPKYIVSLPSGNASNPIDEDELRHAPIKRHTADKTELVKESPKSDIDEMDEDDKAMDRIEKLLAKMAA